MAWWVGRWTGGRSREGRKKGGEERGREGRRKEGWAIENKLKRLLFISVFFTFLEDYKNGLFLFPLLIQVPRLQRA